jgi:hypothetical protein
MSEDDDPFERLDESVGDREGDPFEQLGDADEGDTAADEDAAGHSEQRAASGRDPRSEPEPGYDAHDVTPADHREELDDAERDAPDAADELAGPSDADEQVVETEEPTVKSGHDEPADPEDPFGETGQRTGDPFEDDVFEEMDVGGLDPDDVWDSLSDAQDRGSVGGTEETRYAEVSKHRFCEQCEFFSDPPDVHCSHDGTEILEFLDQETVRVVDCPIVAEREELEKHE